MRTSILVTSAVAALLFVSACGASGGESTATEDSSTTDVTETTETTVAEAEVVPVDEWAASFCSDFADWSETIERAGADIASDLDPGDLEGARTAIEELFAGVAEETEGLIDGLETSGPPDIDDGDEFVADLAEKFQGFVDATNDSKAAAAQVPVDDVATFKTEFEQLIADFQANITEVGDSFGELDTKYPDPDLQEALTSSCAL